MHVRGARGVDAMLEGVLNEGFIPRDDNRPLKTRVIFHGYDTARSSRHQGVRVPRRERLSNADIAGRVGRASQKQRPVRCRTAATAGPATEWMFMNPAVVTRQRSA